MAQLIITSIHYHQISCLVFLEFLLQGLVFLQLLKYCFSCKYLPIQAWLGWIASEHLVSQSKMEFNETKNLVLSTLHLIPSLYGLNKCCKIHLKNYEALVLGEQLHILKLGNLVSKKNFHYLHITDQTFSED